MTTATEIADSINDQVLDAVKQAQDFTVEAVRSWTSAVDLGALPFADQLPAPADVVDKSFELAQRVLVAQKEFVHQVLETISSAPAPAEK